MSRWQWALLLAEVALLSALVVVGFLFHDGAQNLFRNRFWALAAPLLLSWLLLGPPLGLYSRATVASLRRIWRPLLCALAALAVMLWARALWLDAQAISVVFANVFGALLLGSVLGWRLLLYGAVRFRMRMKARASGSEPTAAPIEMELLRGERI